MNSHELFVESKFKKVAELIPPNSKILDIGCNDGKLMSFLNEPIYFGADISKESIFNLKKNKVKAEQVDLNTDELPFKKEKFDFILLLDVLEHIINPEKILNEAKKKLNPQGKLIITFPNDYHILNKIRFVLNKHLTENPFAPYGHLHYFPIKSGRKFLEKNNFKILKEMPLAPVKPQIIPMQIKIILTRLFPQAFARDVLYLIN